MTLLENKISFTDDELAVIYEGVHHMGSFRDVLDKENKIGDVTRNILLKISEKNSDITSAFYVSDHILED